jgi:hypothetical protein
MFQVPASHIPSLPATNSSSETVPGRGATLSCAWIRPQNSAISIAAGSPSADFFRSGVKTSARFCQSMLWKPQTGPLPVTPAMTKGTCHPW